MLRHALLMLILLAASTASGANSIVGVTVDGDVATARIELAGTLDADLTIEFENVVGLSATNLGLSAEIVSPADLLLLSRLPVLGGGGITSGFPVLVRISPPTTGGLSFSGVVSVELYTHDLLYTVGTPLRLFSAPDGGAFRDITNSMGSGSYRVRGSKGQFSEFLIVADLRTTDTVIDTKFNRLRKLLDDYALKINTAAYTELDSLLTGARNQYDSGNTVAAIGQVEAFGEAVAARSGSDIPDIWRSAHDLDNIAGELRAAVGTLRFSLSLASNNLP